MTSYAAVEITKSEIRQRAAMFAKAHAADHSEQAQRQTFWNDFFDVFGVKVRQVAAFEQIAQRASTGGKGWIDLLYPGEMAVEHKSLGEDLGKAMDQCIDYLSSLHPSEAPWLVVACDFARFRWRNLETGDHGEFALADLDKHLDLFWWIAGYNRPGQQFTNDEDANLRATALLAAVHDELAATGYPAHDLREWITRILFCLFADDSGVWDRALLHAFIAQKTRPDGSDLGPQLALVFQVLNTPVDKRQSTVVDDLADLAYVNGDLFAASLAIASCNEKVRTALLAACSFNWSAISPAIFGSLFQNVMTPRERRHLGAHYTTEENILRVIRPLFLDDLEAELSVAATRPKLNAFHNKIASLKFLDPACGCGNFLVVSYRELRRLETDCLRALREKDKRAGQLAVDLGLLCKVTVDQFYGIEIEEFPALIARTALYLADHLANRDVSAEFGEHYARFPIPASPHIVTGNALRNDWNDVLPAEMCDYVMGNPPFVGQYLRSDEQTADLRGIWGSRYQGYLDYVTGWYARALDYGATRAVRFAFVSTNSITQGEPVPHLWGPLLEAGFGIDFAHRTFAWRSEARGQAHVHVVIIGFSYGSRKGKKRLVEYPDVDGSPVETLVGNINPYLVDSPDILVSNRRKPLAPWAPRMAWGSKPVDGGHLMVDRDEYQTVAADPVAARYLRPIIGSHELLSGDPRWCLWLASADPSDLRRSPILLDRLQKVRDFRRSSKKAQTIALSSTPAVFAENRQPAGTFLAVPQTSSSRRAFIPVAFQAADVIASNALYTVDSSDIAIFGILSSSMWMAWVRAVSGRLKSDYQIAAGTVYNTFPFPDATSSQLDRVRESGQVVVDARSQFKGSSLADLYDPLSMPRAVAKAHAGLDRAVDSCFGRQRHEGDASRLRVLFRRYAELTCGDLMLFDGE